MRESNEWREAGRISGGQNELQPSGGVPQYIMIKATTVNTGFSRESENYVRFRWILSPCDSCYRIMNHSTVRVAAAWTEKVRAMDTKVATKAIAFQSIPRTLKILLQTQN